MGRKWTKRGERVAPLPLSPLTLAIMRYGKLCGDAERYRVLATAKKMPWGAFYATRKEVEKQLHLIVDMYNA